MFSSDWTSDMNLSLVSPAEKPALYLPEAGGLIKSQPLQGGAFIHLFTFFTQSQICIGVASATCSHRAAISFLRLSYWSPCHWRVKKKKSYLSIRGDRCSWSRHVCWCRRPRAGKVSLRTHSRPGHTASHSTPGGKYTGTWGRCDKAWSEGSYSMEEPDNRTWKSIKNLESDGSKLITWRLCVTSFAAPWRMLKGRA